MKKSKVIPLVMLGTMLVGGCADTEDVDLKQNTYSTLEDCKKDWNDDKYCSSSPSTHGGGFVYMGPRYYYDRSLGSPVVVDKSGTTSLAPGTRITGSGSTIGHTTSIGRSSVSIGSVSRGGFGGSAHAMSAGG